MFTFTMAVALAPNGSQIKARRRRNTALPARMRNAADAGHSGSALRVGPCGRAGGVALVVKGAAIDFLARHAGAAIQAHAIPQRKCEHARGVKR